MMSGKTHTFPDKIRFKNSMKSQEKQILERIYGRGRGWAFSRKDFSLLTSPESIDKSLARLAEKGTIRRLARGLYDYPRQSRWLDQTLGPDMDQVAHALARKFGWSIQVTGSAALNILGLSTQVPTQYLYLSDGPTKTYEIAGVELRFKKARYTHLGTKLYQSALLVQAVEALGQGGLTPSHKPAIYRYLAPDGKLPEKLKTAIAKDTQYVTGWIQQSILELLNDVPIDGEAK